MTLIVASSDWLLMSSETQATIVIPSTREEFKGRCGSSMKAIHVRTNEANWIPASRSLGEDALYEGRELAYLAVLSDRRAEGGGIAYLLKITPPPGKLVRAIAVARSDENVYLLEGGYTNKAGELIHFPGDCLLNPEGHPHGFFTSVETIELVICRGEPDEIREFGVADIIRSEVWSAAK